MHFIKDEAGFYQLDVAGCAAAWQKAEAGEAPSLKGARWFTFDDIKSMTNNFDDDNTIGVGGYGKVHHFSKPPVLYHELLR